MKLYFTIAFFVTLLVSACISNSVQGDEPLFNVTIKNETDEVFITYQEGITIIDVQSPRGIGTAQFELVSGEMPETILVNLHLTGLEEFRFSTEETTISAFFSKNEIFKNNSQRIISSDGTATPIVSIHPFWLNIKVVSTESNPKIPLAQGYFEVEISKNILDETINSFEIYWIDFYR
jgi:ABC-type Fe3+-hydroxamate transport system substrate-binding protein